MIAVKIPRALVNELLHQAQLGADCEICGLIGARDGVAQHCYPVPNIAVEPQQRFIMDPKTQIDALRQMRACGETLFAIYHSHPTAPAAPSMMDRNEAGYPEALYLIISLNTKGVLEMRGFYIQGEGVAEVALELG